MITGSADEAAIALARRTQIGFMKYCWQKESSPFIVGFHTREIGRVLDEAIEKYRRGESSYLMIELPFRHGKSDIISRNLPARFLGEFPEAEVIVAAYNSDLAKSFSSDCRSIVDSDKYKRLYPNSRLNKNKQSLDAWYLENGIGKAIWVGLNGGATGRGGGLILIDDPFKNREEAESEATRNKRWECFTEAFFTRLPPVHIFILLATPWHVDDFFGRIKKKMEEDPSFPRFKEICFPAKAIDYTGEGEYTGEYLFEERYPKSWYESMYAMIGSYAAAGLLDCNPVGRSGNMINCVEGVNYFMVDEKPSIFKGRIARAWDIASSSPKTSSDPDWTVGVLGMVNVEYYSLTDEMSGKINRIPVVSIYIMDIIRLREEAPTRNRKMALAALRDGPGVTHWVEQFGAHGKDIVASLKKILGGTRIVKGITLKGDKEQKVSEHIEVPFYNGKVYISKSIDRHILSKFLQTLEGFPSAAHDDDADALTILVAALSGRAGRDWWM